jgi:hypothetical protein
MIFAAITACIVGSNCYQAQPPVSFNDVAQCFNMAALAAGQLAAKENAANYSWRVECTGKGEIGDFTVSTEMAHGDAPLPTDVIGPSEQSKALAEILEQQAAIQPAE